MGIGLGDVIDVGADEDQLAGAALAFGGSDSRLGAPDLAFEVVALAALCFQEFFFPGFKLLFEGLLPGQTRRNRSGWPGRSSAWKIRCDNWPGNTPGRRNSTPSG